MSILKTLSLYNTFPCLLTTYESLQIPPASRQIIFPSLQKHFPVLQKFLAIFSKTSPGLRKHCTSLRKAPASRQIIFTNLQCSSTNYKNHFPAFQNIFSLFHCHIPNFWLMLSTMAEKKIAQKNKDEVKKPWIVTRFANWGGFRKILLWLTWGAFCCVLTFLVIKFLEQGKTVGIEPWLALLYIALIIPLFVLTVLKFSQKLHLKLFARLEHALTALVSIFLNSKPGESTSGLLKIFFNKKQRQQHTEKFGEVSENVKTTIRLFMQLFSFSGFILLLSALIALVYGIITLMLQTSQVELMGAQNIKLESQNQLIQIQAKIDEANQEFEIRKQLAQNRYEEIAGILKNPDSKKNMLQFALREIKSVMAMEVPVVKLLESKDEFGNKIYKVDNTNIEKPNYQPLYNLLKAHEKNFAEFNLSGIDLSGLNLYQANLQGAYLRSAKLQGADLEKAKLQGAYLWEANLQGADLPEANLQGADLSYAKLQGAELWNAKLQGADLWVANLQGAYLPEANLQGADLTEANLQGAYLPEANLQGADLSYAKLQGANLPEANLQGADLSYAKLQGADLWNAKLQGACAFEPDEAKIYKEVYEKIKEDYGKTLKFSVLGAKNTKLEQVYAQGWDEIELGKASDMIDSLHEAIEELKKLKESAVDTADNRVKKRYENSIARIEDTIKVIELHSDKSKYPELVTVITNEELSKDWRVPKENIGPLSWQEAQQIYESVMKETLEAQRIKAEKEARKDGKALTQQELDKFDPEKFQAPQLFSTEEKAQAEKIYTDYQKK